MTARPVRNARNNHKVLGEFAGNSLYAPSTGYLLKNKPELVEAAAAQVLRKNRDAAIRQSVVLKAVRGEVTASVAADQCGVGRSTMCSKLRSIKKKVSIKKTALPRAKGRNARKPAATTATNGPAAEVGDAAQQANVNNALALEANAAVVPEAAHDPLHSTTVPPNEDLRALVEE
ncbi:hypothetical protein AAVH_08529 [Aphelenchoides avenae]|nr:hypothetical protein AAVH_08529 [Aphelenchus avenae]